MDIVVVMVVLILVLVVVVGVSSNSKKQGSKAQTNIIPMKKYTSLADFFDLDFNKIFDNPDLKLIEDVETENGNRKQFIMNLPPEHYLMGIFNKMIVVQFNNSKTNYNVILTSIHLNYATPEIKNLISYMADKYGKDSAGKGHFSLDDQKDITDGVYWTGRTWGLKAEDLMISYDERQFDLKIFGGLNSTSEKENTENTNSPIEHIIPTSSIENKPTMETPPSWDRFVVIDFETANNDLSSICSIGLAFSDGFNVTESKHYYVKPIPYIIENTHINHISESDVNDAPTFAEVWAEIYTQIKGKLLFTYNAEFDANCLREAVKASSMPEEYYHFDFACVYELTKSLRDNREILDLPESLKLTSVCKVMQIDYDNAHNAESDAEATAELLNFYALLQSVNGDLESLITLYSDRPITNIENIKSRQYFRNSVSVRFEKKKFDRSLLNQDLSNVSKKTIFYDAKVVITGDFTTISRTKMAEILHDLGADINTTISRKTNYVIIGEKAGPSKLEKIKALQEDGNDIKTLSEAEFLNEIK